MDRPTLLKCASCSALALIDLLNVLFGLILRHHNRSSDWHGQIIFFEIQQNLRRQTR